MKRQIRATLDGNVHREILDKINIGDRRHTLVVIGSMHLQSDSIRLSFILRVVIARIDTEVKVCRHLWLYSSKQVCGLNTSTILANFRHFLDPSRFNKSG